MKREVKEAHVYFPAKLLLELKRLAERNRRSVSAEIVMAVEAHVDKGNQQVIMKSGFQRDVQPFDITLKRPRGGGK